MTALTALCIALGAVYLAIGFTLTACFEVVRNNVFPRGARIVGPMPMRGWILNTVAWPYVLPQMLRPRGETRGLL